MNNYLGNRLVKIGLAVLVLGSGPLLGIIILAKVGVWPDPNPNPIGPGMLAGVTFWPAIICLGIVCFGSGEIAGRKVCAGFST